MVEILSCETVLLDSVLVSSMDVNTSSTVDKTSWEPSFEHLSKLDVPKYKKYKKHKISIKMSFFNFILIGISIRF